MRASLFYAAKQGWQLQVPNFGHSVVAPMLLLPELLPKSADFLTLFCDSVGLLYA